MRQRKQNAPLPDSYGWIVVIGVFLILMVFMGTVNNCYALFIIPVTEDLGFSRSRYSLCQSLFYLFCMFGSAGCWKVYKRFGLLSTIRAACVILSASYFMYSKATHLITFYLISSVIGICMGLTTTAAAPILLRRWFSSNYSFALGVAMTGSGIGGMFFNPIASAIIEQSSWRSAYAVLSIIMGAVSIPIAFFIFREGPAQDDQAPPADLPENTCKTKTESDPLKRRKFVLMAVVLLFSLACTTYLYVVTPHLQDIGYSARFASSCASATMAALALGKLCQGYMLDRLSVERCSLIAFAGAIVGLLGLGMFLRPIMLLPVLIGIALSCPFCTVATPALSASVCRTSDEQNETTGQFTAAVNLGSALSPIFSGIVYDTMSSYVPLLMICTVIVVSCILCIVWLFRK